MPDATSQSPEQSQAWMMKLVKAPPRGPRANHPISIGTRVTVVRCGERTAPFIEGIAIVKGVTPIPHRYAVQFVGERTIRHRSVFDEFQREPERLLAVLRGLWRAETAAAADLTDFFPDDAGPQTRG